MKSRFVILAIGALTFVSIDALASEPDSNGVIFASTQRVIKWNPFAMVDFTPAAQFSYEYPFGLNRTIQHEIGFISHTVNPFLAFNDNLDITGVKLKTEIRYYTGQGRGPGDFYIAPELSYKFYSNKSTDWFTRYDGSYEQLLDYKGDRHVAGANLKFGSIIYVKNIPLVWDYFIGFGIKYRYVTSNLPEDAIAQGPTAVDSFNELYYMSPGGSLRFSVVGGIRLGYVLPEK